MFPFFAAISVLPLATDPNQLTGIAAWAVNVMEWLGSVGIALLVALENLFPPIPSEIILPLAGFTASLGSFTLVAAIFWATVGSVVGAIALYYVGFVLGRERTRKLMGALPLVRTEDIVKTEAWFDKHGTKTVLIGRFIPIFRSLISIPAGVTRIPLLTFTILTTIGSLIWNTALVLAGYFLGENWDKVEPVVGVLQWIVIAAVLVGLVWFVYTHLKKRNAPADGVSDNLASDDVDAAGSADPTA